MKHFPPPLRSALLSASLSASLLIFLPVSSPQAACGLHAPASASDETPHAITLGLSLRRTAIENGGDPGGYSELGLEARYAPFPLWAFTLQWPVAMLNLRDSLRFGSGNPSLQAEIRKPLGSAYLRRLGLGAQVEAPLGLHADGLAGDNFMATIFASLSGSMGGMAEGTMAATEWDAGLGMVSMLPWMGSHAAGMDHSMHGSMPGMSMPPSSASPSLAGQSLGSPHENWEALYRIGVRRGFFAGRTALSAALEGQHVLSRPMHMDGANPDSDARDFLTAEIEPTLVMGRGATGRTGSISPFIQWPVSPAQRTGWTLGLRTGLTL